ncbi:MAG: hypothetical protein PHV49_00930 [Alistipes sp.]|nr:hypothetical protein [Alistipes sp.]
MATVEKIIKKIEGMTDKIIAQAPRVVGGVAANYYRDRFRQKAWNGEAWAPTKHFNTRGSLMLRTGRLRATIRVAEPSTQEGDWVTALRSTPARD